MIIARLNQNSRAMPGSGLPFYPAALTPQALETKEYYDFICPMVDGISFQVGLPPGTFTSAAIRRYNVGVSSSIPINVAVYSFAGMDIISWDGQGHNFPSSGAFFVRINAQGTLYESEVFEVANLLTQVEACGVLVPEPIIEIRWEDTKRWVGGAYYDEGYVNRAWVRAKLSRTKFQYEEEVEKDGFGRSIPVLQVTNDIYSFDVYGSDSLLLMLQRIAHHDTISIRNEQSDQFFPIHDVRVADTGAKSNKYAVFEVSFKSGGSVESTSYNFDTFQ